jgi:anti-sigma B factor antagonist
VAASVAGFTVERSQEGGLDVFELHGELDSNAAGTLESEVHEAIVRGASRLMFDLRGLSFIDSSGLQVLVRALHRVWPVGGSVWVVGANARTSRVFQITGLDRVFKLAETPEEAYRTVEIVVKPPRVRRSADSIRGGSVAPTA